MKKFIILLIYCSLFVSNVTLADNIANPLDNPPQLDRDDPPGPSIVWDEEFGYDEDPERAVLDWNLRYQDLFTGINYSMWVTFENVTIDDIHVEIPEFNSELFSSNPDDEFVIEPGEEVNIEVIFESENDEPVDVDAIMTIYSDYRWGEEIEVRLHARALLPPQMDIDPQALEVESFTGGVEERTITAANNGDSVLRIRVDVEIEGENDEWIYIEPLEDEIEPDDETEFLVTIDCFQLAGGDYTADLIFNSNDPDNAEITVSVVLHVTDAPDMFVDWEGHDIDCDCEDEHVIDWNWINADVFNGTEYDVALTIRNDGTEDLVIESIEFEGDDGEHWSAPDEFDVIAAREETDIIITFSSEESGEFEAVMIINSNDPDNGAFEIYVIAVSGEPPVINLDPQELNIDIVSGEVEEFEITVTNEGEGDLRFHIDVEFVREHERDHLQRGVRNVRQRLRFADNQAIDDNRPQMPNSQDAAAVEAYLRKYPVEEFGPPLRDPVPDDPPESVIALITDTRPWGYDLNRIFNHQYLEGLEWERFQSFDDDFDLDDFDVIWVGNYNTDEWTEIYNDHLEEIEEWVADGGSYYMCTGTNYWEVAPIHPGGLLRTERSYAPSGQIAIDPEECYFFEMMGWDEDTLFEGNWFCHATYSLDNLANIEGVDENDVRVLIEGPIDGNNLPIVAEYQFGRGMCVVSGTTDGYGNGIQNQLWNRSNVAMVYYLDFLANQDRWLGWEPDDGIIEAGEEILVTVTIDAAGLYEGDYRAELNFFSNDPENPIVTVDISIAIVGQAIIDVVWDEDAGYVVDENGVPDPDNWALNWNGVFDDLYVLRPYDIPVTISNIGTADMEIDEVYTNTDDVMTDWDEEIIVLAGGEKILLRLTLEVEEAGSIDEDAALIIFSPDIEEEDFVIPLVADVANPPVMRVEPNEIEIDMGRGVREEAITITNEGESELRYNIDVEFRNWEDRDVGQRNVRRTDGAPGPRRDDAGDLLGEFQGINGRNQWTNPAGWDPDAEVMWVNNYNTQVAVAYTHDASYEEFEEVVRIEPGQCMDGTVSHGLAHFNRLGNGTIARYNIDGDMVGNIQVNHNLYGMAADDENEWFFAQEDGNNYAIHVYDYTNGELGEQLGVINNHMQYHENSYVYGLEWVGAHPEGQLWMVQSNNGTLYQIAVDTEEWTCVDGDDLQSFHVGYIGHPYASVGHDGENMWVGGKTTTNIRIYADGVYEDRWLSVDPTLGEIAGGAEQDVILTFDATGLIEGDYEADVVIHSNDPENPDVVVIISLRVFPGGFDIYWEEEFGYNVDPDEAVLDFNAAYDPDLFAGRPYGLSVILENNGTDDLEIIDIWSDNEAFISDWNEEVEVYRGGDRFELVIYFEVEIGQADDYVGVITIDTRDVAEDIEIFVTASPSEPPEIRVEPEEIDAEGAWDFDDEIITIGNEGESELSFSIDIEYGRGEERDVAQRNVRRTDGAPGPTRDEPGNLLGEFQGINAENQYCSIAGWDPVAEVMWMSNYNTQTIAAFTHDEDYEEFEEIVRVQTSFAMDGAVSHGLAHFTRPGQSTISRYDIAGEMMGQIQFDHDVYGLAADDGNEWLFAQERGNNYAIHVYDYSDGELGEELGIINNHMQFHGNIHVYGLEWVPDHPDGQLWMVQYNNGTLYQIAVDTEEWACIDGEDMMSFNIGNIRQPHAGVGHDGENVWAGGYGADDIRIYDDGVFEANWIAIDPDEGTVAPGEEAEIVVSFNTDDLLENEYEAALIITSNDPVSPVIEIPVYVHIQDRVRGGTFRANPTARPYDGAERLDFGEIMVNTVTGIFVQLINLSAIEIEISGVEIVGDDADNWSTNIDDGTIIEVRSSIEAHLIYTPNDAGDHSATIWINTDADVPEDGRLGWDVMGTAILGPEIAVDPEALFAYVGRDPVESTMTISNIADEGAADLVFLIYTEVVEHDHRDLNWRSVRRVDGNSADRDERGDDGEEDGYEWRDSDEADGVEYDWIDIPDYFDEDDITAMNFTDDSNRGPFNLGFEFEWYGNTYEQIRMCSNGWASFTDAGGAWYWMSREWPSNDAATNALEVARTDWNPSRGGGTYLFASDGEMAVCSWIDNPHIGGGGSWTYQIVLYENGLIKYQYQDVDANVGQWQVAFQNAGRNVGALIYRGGAGYLENDFAIGIGTEAMFGLPWLSVDPMEGSVAPGEETEIEITWDVTNLEEGEYRGLLVIESNDPDNPVVEIDVLMIYVPPHDPILQFEETEEWHTLIIEEATFDGHVIGNGWEIGVLDPDGNLGGAGVWNGVPLEIRAYSSAEDVDQFDANEAFAFIYWNPNDGEEWGAFYDAQAQWAEGDAQVWNADAESSLSLSGGSTHSLTLELDQRWNMISINVMLDPDEYEHDRGNPGPVIPSMFAEFEDFDDDGNHRVLILKAGNGNFWNPDFGFNNILYWDYAQGYQIKLREGADITFEGRLIPADTDIPMRSHWNMIAYFPTYTLDASAEGEFYVLSPIIDRVILAREGNGDFLNPEFDFSMMEPWSEGKGYQVKLNEEGEEDIIFNYPEEQDDRASVEKEIVKSGHWHTPIQTDVNMSVLINSFIGFEVSENDQVAAFSATGDLVGLGSIIGNRCGMAIWGDDVSTDAVDGMENGDTFTFKYWDSAEDETFDLSFESLANGVNHTYQANGFLAIEVEKMVDSPSEFYMTQSYPNPFNNRTVLRYGLPNAGMVDINLYDISGRVVKTYGSLDKDAGTHEIAINATGLGSGVFILRVEFEGITRVRKIVLTK